MYYTTTYVPNRVRVSLFRAPDAQGERQTLTVPANIGPPLLGSLIVTWCWFCNSLKGEIHAPCDNIPYV